MTFLFRDEDLTKLREAYNALVHQRLQIRFIVGKTGMGKTVLLDHFLEEVEGKDERVLVMGCACTMAGEEFQPFKDILQEMICELTTVEHEKQRRKEKWKRVFGTSADVLLKIAPDLIGNFVPMGGLVNAIGERVLEESGIRDKIEKLKIGNGVLPDVLKLSDQYLEILKRIAGQYKVIVYIDNLQWADRSSLELLQRLQIGLKRLPVMLIGCYRSADLVYGTGGERHPLETLVTHAKVSDGDVFVDLDARSEKIRREWIKQWLELERVDSNQDFLNEMYLRTGGNPLYVRELVRVMDEQGVWRNCGKTGSQITTALDWHLCPVRIEGVVCEEVSALAGEKIEVLSLAAVQGQRFLLSVLACMVEKEEEELLNWMTEELGRQRHLVYEGECFRRNGKLISTFYFSDRFLQEYLYKGLGVSRRMLLHGKVAVLLEELYADKIEEIAYEIARHYEQSGEVMKALNYYEICALKAEKEADYKKEIECTEAALRITGCSLQVWGLRRLRAMRRSGVYSGDRLQEIFKSDCPDDPPEGWKLEQWHILLLKGQLKQAEAVAGRLENNRVPVGITAFWLGDFRLCRKMLEGEKEGIFYLALAEFQCGEYGRANDLYRQWAESLCEDAGERMAIALLGVWLAFLDEDAERMKAELKRVTDLRCPEHESRMGNWLAWFESVLVAETEIWKGLEQIDECYRKMKDGRGVTLYGVIGCRLCLKKDLYGMFDRWWEKAVQLALESGEKAYLGELYLLEKRRLEVEGRGEEVAAWIQKIQEWREESGGWLLDCL